MRHALEATGVGIVNGESASVTASFSFRPLVAADLPMLHAWLGRAHVARWWGDPSSYAQVESHYRPHTDPASPTRGYVALLDGEPAGFIQVYVVMGSGDGRWEDETDPGARGIDLFLADPTRLRRGLGAAMIGAFVARLFDDRAVSRVQPIPRPTIWGRSEATRERALSRGARS